MSGHSVLPRENDYGEILRLFLFSAGTISMEDVVATPVILKREKCKFEGQSHIDQGRRIAQVSRAEYLGLTS